MDNIEKFTEEIIKKANNIYRNNPGLKKEELIFRIKCAMGLKGTANDVQHYNAWQLEPETFHKILVKIVEIIILLEDSSRRLKERKRSKEQS